jgi:ParB-like chromosome segregation protein Spo0J
LRHRISTNLLDGMVVVSQEVWAGTAMAMVPIEQLLLGFSPRRRGVSSGHVEQLVESGGDWPPILVQRSTMKVIDGAHRLAAARALRWTEVEVVFFDGDDEQALVEAIRCNRSHGLPLTLQDRKAAARDLLARHPDWSDGRVAEICSLSPKTVANQRRQPSSVAPLTGPGAVSQSRLGRDGRLRPVPSTAVRARIAQAIAYHPDASLRAIAAATHTSPETVRSVRRSLQRHEAPPAQPVPTLAAFGNRSSSAHVPSPWSADSACQSTPEGAAFAGWFDATQVEESALFEHLTAVPVSRIYGVIDEAHRRAQFWASFANRLSRRIGH